LNSVLSGLIMVHDTLLDPNAMCTNYIQLGILMISYAPEKNKSKYFDLGLKGEGHKATMT